MSHKLVHVTELYKIASDIYKLKTQNLVSKYYNEILVAAHEGKFSITFILENDCYGEMIPEERDAMEMINKLFPGIHNYYDRNLFSCSFVWDNK